MRVNTKAPAGVKNHHAYPGGLLEHVVNVMEVVKLIAPRYPAIDPDLLLLGVLVPRRVCRTNSRLTGLFVPTRDPCPCRQQR